MPLPHFLLSLLLLISIYITANATEKGNPLADTDEKTEGRTDSLKRQPFADRLETTVSVLGSFTGEAHQNFWITSNRFGMLQEDGANALSLLSAYVPLRMERKIDWAAGADVLLRASPRQEAYLHQAYVEGKWGVFRMMAGRRETILGMNPYELSSGSAAMSNNARPVPRIELSAPDFFPLPYTRGWLEAKGHMAHGWLRDDRYVSNALLHDKSLYLQTGSPAGFGLYFGVVHMAIWAGNSPIYEQLPSGFVDFIRVFFSYQGDEDAPDNEVNALGFHSGIYDMGLRTTWNHRPIHLYYQHIFTDGSGMKFRNLGDGLFGLNVGKIFPALGIDALTLEWLDTRHQSGMGLSDRLPWDWPDFCAEQNCGFPYGGRDNYYNNTIYPSGLSYHGLSMGSPFFLTRAQLDTKNRDINTYSPSYFVSTRNLAYHLGISGKVSGRMDYRLMASQVQYYGTYEGLNLGTPWGYYDPENNPEDYFFNPPRKQWYIMMETSFSLLWVNNLTLTPALGWDFGDLFNTQGIYLNISWSPTQ